MAYGIDFAIEYELILLEVGRQSDSEIHPKHLIQITLEPFLHIRHQKNYTPFLRIQIGTL